MFDINAGQDLENLVRKLSVSAKVPETFDLLCPKASENLAFRAQSQGGKIPHVTAAMATATATASVGGVAVAVAMAGTKREPKFN